MLFESMIYYPHLCSFPHYPIRNDSYGDPDGIQIYGTPWTKIAADFKYIDAGEQYLWACDKDNNVWRHYIDEDIHIGEGSFNSSYICSLLLIPQKSKIVTRQ